MANDLENINPYFQNALQDYGDMGLQVPPFQSPYQPAPFGVPQQDFMPAPDMAAPTPEQPAFGIDPMQMAQGLMEPRPPTAQVEPVKTPWFVKALGGVQDALALVSHIKNPQSQAQFGGLAAALLGARHAANVETLSNKAKAEAWDKRMSEVGQAIALRTVAGTIAGEKKQPGDIFSDQLAKSGLSLKEQQVLKLAYLRKQAGMDKKTWKGPIDQRIAALTEQMTESEDPEEKANLQEVIDALKGTIKEVTTIKSDVMEKRQINVKKTPGAPTAKEPGELAAGKKRMMDTELADLADKERTITKELEAKKARNIKYKMFPDLQDMEGEKEIQDRLDSNRAEQEKIRSKYTETAIKGKQNDLSGWSLKRID